MLRLFWILVLFTVSAESQSANSSAPNNHTSTSVSGLGVIIQKLFNRGSSEKKHADKNRIILEELNNNQANAQSANSSQSAVAFHDEETVAVISYLNKTVENCKLMEVRQVKSPFLFFPPCSLFSPV